MKTMTKYYSEIKPQIPTQLVFLYLAPIKLLNFIACHSPPQWLQPHGFLKTTQKYQ